MRKRSVLLLSFGLFTSLCPGISEGGIQEKRDLAIEEKIVHYLKEHSKPGEPLVVSDLHNNVFKSTEERKVLDRLFNTFFKIPLFVAQYKASTNQIPTLADIARQFNLPIEGEAAVLLSIIDNDPRVPKFIVRDAKTGEITGVNIEAVKKDRRFGQVLERTLSGWVGRDAPPFYAQSFEGKPFSSEDLKGKNYLLYFWFSGCPPCVRISPHLVELQRKFGNENFTVVGVNADRFLELETTDDQRSAYVKKEHLSFPLVHLNRKMQEDYGNVNVYPTLFLVDSGGVIQKNYVSYQTLNIMMDDVAALLKSEHPQ
ncbi:MAG TPA: TlpA disulfide reductase family protein [Acidobacteriota bacterium]|nr:TlpA disulfide reductase family protein [Acidobacteriota bacterium]